MSRAIQRLRRRPRTVLAAAVATVVTTVSAVVVVVGCTSRTAAATTISSTAAAEAPTAGDGPSPLAAADVDRILAEVSAAGAAAGGTIATVALGADGSTLVKNAQADQPRYTASLVKIPLVGRLLALDTAGALTLSLDDLSLMQQAVTSSSDTAMSALWVRYDGARLVAETAAALGLTATGPPAALGQWGQAWTSASDTATVLATLPLALATVDAATLLGWMRSTTPVAADGFDQRFGLLAGAADGVAAKQGWMCCVGDRRQLHSAGVLGDGRVVVLMGDFPAATSWAQAASALDRAAAAVRAGTG